jgi:tyrosyl-tRNA synthetase
MLAGRTLMRKLKNKEKFVLTMKLLEDPVSGKKMGKTEGNGVTLTAAPEEMYGKVMSWPDELIVIAFELLTQVPMVDIEQMKKDMVAGQNPKQFKMVLAHTIAEMHHGAKAADQAEVQFKKMFEQHARPDDMPVFKIATRNIVDVLMETKLASSKGDARRLIQQGAVRVDEKVVTDEQFQLSEVGGVVQKGKRYFVKVVR